MLLSKVLGVLLDVQGATVSVLGKAHSGDRGDIVTLASTLARLVASSRRYRARLFADSSLSS